MAESIVLVVGGARSGKSAFAERLAVASDRPVVFLATGTAGDDEMRARIERHRAQRPPIWRTFEEPTRVAECIRSATRPGDLIVLDCLTLWTSNLLLASPPENSGEDGFAVAAEDLIKAIRDARVSAILVSNEVGLGIVPATELGRAYRDALGRVNQVVAASAELVFLMVTGLPVNLRALADRGFDDALALFATDSEGDPGSLPDERGSMT